MEFSITAGSMKGLMEEIEGDISEAATGAMRQASRETVMELREQVRGAGLGNRLANSWRDRVYPESGRSLVPTGYLWSNASAIVDAFSRGATIRPVNGAQYLWIPSNNVPRARGRMSRFKRQTDGSMRSTGIKGGPLTPEECEDRFRTDFVVLRGKNGNLLAFMELVRARNNRGVRQATSRRLAQGRQAKLTFMFTLVRSVRLPKLLDLQGPAQRGAARFEVAFNERLGSR